MCPPIALCAHIDAMLTLLRTTVRNAASLLRYSVVSLNYNKVLLQSQPELSLGQPAAGAVHR